MSEIFGMHMTHKSLSAMCWMCFMVAMPCWIDVHECFASDKAFSDGDYDGSVIEKAAQGKMFSDLDCSRLWKVGNEPDICASIKDKYLILDKGDIDGHLGLIRILGYGMKRRWTIPFYSSDTNVQDPCVQALKELFAGVSEGQAIERRRILFLLSPLLEEEEILLMVTDVASLRPNISDDMKAMLEQARLVESDRAYLEYARTSWRKYVLQWRRSRCEIVYCLLACGTKSSIETAIGQIDQCIQDNCHHRSDCARI